MNINEKYFSNLTSRERAIFEGGISMGALFHQFIGTPISINTKESLEIAMENAFKLQPAIEDVKVNISFEQIEKAMTYFEYTTLNGDMLDVKILTKVDNTEAIIRIKFIEELNYPLVYVENIKD